MAAPDDNTRWTSLADRLNPNRAAFDAKFKEEWRTLDRASKRALLAEDERRIRELRDRAIQQPLPFVADADDHCETSKTAFGHIVPVLQLLARRLNKSAAELRIYDPYYCAGAVVRHFKELGFDRVHNRPDDFYRTIAEGSIPPHDVLITNPPYSAPHLDKLKEFLAGSGPIPHLLLLPDHFPVNPEDYAILKPTERYHYWTPRGLRPEEDSKKRKHRNLVLGSRNSPFPSQWCISLQPVVAKEELLDCLEGMLPAGCRLYEKVTTKEGKKEGAIFRRKDATVVESNDSPLPSRIKKDQTLGSPQKRIATLESNKDATFGQTATTGMESIDYPKRRMRKSCPIVNSKKKRVNKTSKL